MKHLYVLSLVIFAASFLQGCGYTHKIKLYKNIDNPPKINLIPVTKTIETDNKHLKKAMKLIALPVVLESTADSRSYSSMKLEYNALKRRPENWGLGRYYQIDELWRLAQNMNNELLSKKDITIIELKIIGLSNHKEVKKIKLFVGAVKSFDWVELFKVKVPKDKAGYIMTASAYVNYVSEFNIKNKKDYFIRVPVSFSDYNSSIFSTYPYSPFLDFDYKNGRITLFHKHTPDDSDRGKFFEKSHINLSGKTYKHFYYMNPKFLNHNDMLKTQQAFVRNKRKKLAQAARKAKLYSTYKDEKAFEEIVRSTDKSTKLIVRIKRALKYRIKNARLLATARSRSTAKRGIAASNAKNQESYSVMKYRFTTAKNTVLNNMVLFKKLAERDKGIQIRASSLKSYNKAISTYAKTLPEAEDRIADYRSAITNLIGTSPKSSPSFLSIVGQAMANEAVRGGFSNAAIYGETNSSGMAMINDHLDAMKNARINQSLYDAGYHPSYSSQKSNKQSGDTLIIIQGPKLEVVYYGGCDESALSYANKQGYGDEANESCTREREHFVGSGAGK